MAKRKHSSKRKQAQHKRNSKKSQPDKRERLLRANPDRQSLSPSVCKRLRELGHDRVGIVYNFHHGHGQIEDWAESLLINKLKVRFLLGAFLNINFALHLRLDHMVEAFFI